MIGDVSQLSDAFETVETIGAHGVGDQGAIAFDAASHEIGAVVEAKGAENRNRALARGSLGIGVGDVCGMEVAHAGDKLSEQLVLGCRRLVVTDDGATRIHPRYLGQCHAQLVAIGKCLVEGHVVAKHVEHARVAGAKTVSPHIRVALVDAPERVGL